MMTKQCLHLKNTHQHSIKKEKEEEGDDDSNEDEIDKRKKYFSEKSEYCPETKIEMQEVMEEIKLEKANNGAVLTQEKKTRQLFMRYLYWIYKIAMIQQYVQ